MANESSFNGNRFLVDAKNSRQYALSFVHGKITLPIQVFATDERDNGFKPNEVIFAFDEGDENELVKTADGRILLTTLAYQIETNATAKVSGLALAPIAYEMTHGKDATGAHVLRYQLTADSVQAMEASGFDPAFPSSFVVPLDANAATLNLSALANVLPFPPHHDNGAYVAHAAVEQPQPQTVIAPQPFSKTEKRPDGTLPAKRPAEDFKRTAPPRARANYKVQDATIEALLKQYCKDYTALAANGHLDPVVGRKEETDQALKVLTRRKQSSLCFTGDAGVGKTAMFAAIAQRIVDDTMLPETLKGARVLELNLQAMNAGAKYRGQFEEKLQPLIDGLQEREGILNGRKIILAIDELHSQLTSGKAEGGTDSGNMMKSFLTARGISVMGTTTDDEYKKHIEKDPALSSRFEKMRLLPPNVEDTVAIIKRLWPLTKEHNHLTNDLTDEEISYIVTMTNRYAPQEAQPRKSEKVMNMAAASAEFSHRTEINRADILTAVAQMSNLPLDFLNQSDHERFLKLETELPKEVLGQPGLQRIVDGLVGARSGLTDENQPWGCFVLQGPTGVGKTETCKALARYLFGTEDAMITLNMGEYMEKYSVSRLIGAPPGYVGFEDAQPALTEKIRQRPYAILLLDEIEKAHPDVFNVFLPLLNDGKMTDNQGRTVLFNNVIVVMTTNAGADAAAKILNPGAAGAGIAGSFGASSEKAVDPEKQAEDLAKVYRKAVTTPGVGTDGAPRGALFRPEMINRIEELGGFITYRPLDEKVISGLVVRELDKVNKRLNSQAGANLKDVTLDVTPEVMTRLVKDGYNPAMGARPLRKVVREKIANKFGKWLIGNREKVLAFIAENGPSKIMVDSVDNFEPKLMKIEAVADVANDNATSVVDKAADAMETLKRIVAPKQKI